MDEYNIQWLYDMQPEDSQAKIELLGKYDPAGILIIRDPVFVCITRDIYPAKSRNPAFNKIDFIFF